MTLRCVAARLREGRADAGVHSLKDLATKLAGQEVTAEREEQVLTAITDGATAIIPTGTRSFSKPMFMCRFVILSGSS